MRILLLLLPLLSFAGNAPIDTSAQNVTTLGQKPDGSLTKFQFDSSGRIIIRPLTSALDTLNVANFPASQPVTGTVAVTQATSPWVTSATQSGAWSTGRTWNLGSSTDSVTALQGTSPWVVSGTVVSNIGTTNGLALDTTVASLQVAQGSGTSGQKGPLGLAAVTTSSPTYTSGQSNALSLTTAGALRVDASGLSAGRTWTLSSSTDSVSSVVTSSVLPTGASTSALQTTGNTSLSSIDSKLTSPLTVTVNNQPTTIAVSNFPATQAVSGTVTANQGTSPWVTSVSNFPTTQAVSGSTTSLGAVTTAAPTYTTGQSSPLSLTLSGALRTDGSATTQPISAVALPLPSGAATLAAQTTGNSSLSSIDTKTPALVSGRVPVDGSGVTQPVSGTVNAVVTQPTGTNLHVVVDSSALPTGAATSALQTSGNSSLTSIDSKTPALVSGRQPVDGSGVTQPVSGSVTANVGTTGGLALDTTVAALQVAQGSTTSSQKGSLSLAAVSSSAPSYTTAQTSALSLTVAGALRVDGSAVVQPVSGTVTSTPSGVQHTIVDSGTVTLAAGANAIGSVSVSNFPTTTAVTQATGTNLHTFVDNFPATQPVSGSVSVSNFPATQSVSGSVTANIGTTGGLALDTSVQALEVAQGSTTAAQKGTLSLGAVSTSAPTYTTAQSNAISLTTAGATRVDASATTQPVSAVALPLPTGASTSSLQTTGNSSLSSIDGKLTTTTNGLKVDNSAVTQPVSATALPLPAGASTSALQTTGNSSLATIATQDTATATALGTPADTAATSDTGTFSLIALFKRAMASYWSSIQNTSNSTAVNTSNMVTQLTAIYNNQTNGTQRVLVSDLVGNLQPSGASPALAIFTNSRNPSAAAAGKTQTLTTTSAAVYAANTARLGMHLTNTSSLLESCDFGTAAVAGSGIVIYPGGTFDMDEYSFSTAALNCISTASATIAAKEF